MPKTSKVKKKVAKAKIKSVSKVKPKHNIKLKEVLSRQLHILRIGFLNPTSKMR